MVIQCRIEVRIIPKVIEGRFDNSLYKIRLIDESLSIIKQKGVLIEEILYKGEDIL